MAAMTVRAVVFDLDGTLVDTMTSAPQAYADTVRDLSGCAVSIEDVIEVWNLGPTRVVLTELLSRDATDEDLKCFTKNFRVAVAEVQPFPGILSLLRQLTSSGRSLSIFTTATQWAAELMLENSGIAGWFSSVIGGDFVSTPKPAAEGLHLACDSLGVSPEAAAYVGDAPVDIACARSAGALAIHASWGCGGMIDGNHLTARTPADVLRFVERAAPAEPRNSPRKR